MNPENPKEMVRIDFLHVDHQAAEALDLPAFVLAGLIRVHLADGSVIESKDGHTWGKTEDQT